MDFLFLIPVLIVAVITIPLIILFYFNKRKQATVLFSSLSLFDGVKPSIKYKLRHIPFFLFLLAYICLLIAIARPRSGYEIKTDYKEGIAIQIVLDRSSSMGDIKMAAEDGSVINYFELNKRMARNFIIGNDELEGRDNDMIGLSTFAGFVEEICPLTLDHNSLESILNNTDTVRYEWEDGTAIGDAVYYAALNLIAIDEYLIKGNEDYKIKSKIIILLTDGLNNKGIDVNIASDFAKENNIKVYPVIYMNERMIRQLNLGNTEITRGITSLDDMASKTEGKFYQLFEMKDLLDVYKDIDTLEKSKLEEGNLRYSELYQYFLIAALILIFIEIILSQTLLKRIP